jgi:putative addiction module component, TIGR02574 family
MTSNEVLSAALDLDTQERLLIAVRLLETVSPDLSELSEHEWLEELNRRSEEHRKDPSTAIPWNQLRDEVNN